MQSPVRSPLGEEAGGSVSQTFDELIASLLSAGEDVAFYDPNDLTSIYAARTGGANAVADGPVGLMLDKAQMGGLTAAAFIAAQPELVTNGTFDTDTTGWSISGATLSESGGVLEISAQSTSPVNGTQSLTALVVGRAYLVTGTYWQTGSGGTAARISLFGTTTPNNSTSTPLTASMVVIATGTTATLSLASFGNSSTVSHFDNISVVEIPGYHATAPSDAARPILRDVSSTYALDFDNVDDVHNIVLPDDGYDTWTVASDGSVTFGTTTLSGGTGYALNTDNAGFGITTATLTAAQKSIIEASY